MALTSRFSSEPVLSSWRDPVKRGYARSKAESAYPEAWESLVGAWAPELGPQGGRLPDYSRGRSHGTLTNMTDAWILGANPLSPGYVLDYDGVNDSVQIAETPQLVNIWSGGATAVAWIAPRSFGEGGSGRIADKSLDSGSGSGWGFLILGGPSRLSYQRDFSTQRGLWATTDPAITLDTWQHVAVTYDDSSTANDPIFYINGVERPIGQEIVTPSGSAVSDAGIDLVLGNLGATAPRTFDGLIGSVKLYTRILTAQEIQRDYQIGLRPFVLRRRRVRSVPAFRAFRPGRSRVFAS